MYGRKHCYRLYTKHFNEAVHWACGIQKIIDTKAPVETPTLLLIRDIEVSHRLNRTIWSLESGSVSSRAAAMYIPRKLRLDIKKKKILKKKKKEIL